MGHRVQITHRFEFSAAHRLECAELDEEQNLRLYGPCYTDHGHNYEVEVTVVGEVDAQTGMVMNLADLAEIVRRRLFEPVDHKHLNRDVPFLEGIVPTAENVAVAFWNEVEPEIRPIEGCRLHRIRIYESRANFVDYLGEESPGSSASS